MYNRATPPNITANPITSWNTNEAVVKVNIELARGYLGMDRKP